MEWAYAGWFIGGIAVGILFSMYIAYRSMEP